MSLPRRDYVSANLIYMKIILFYTGICAGLIILCGEQLFRKMSKKSETCFTNYNTEIQGNLNQYK